MPTFKSKYEEEIFHAAQKNGFNIDYETVKLSYQVTSNYLPDFILPNGIIVEAKGYFDIKAQVKMKAVKKAHPHLDIRFVFMNSRTKIRKGSKLTYADWCERYGFPYADGMIPIKWFKEKTKKVTYEA